MSDMSDSGAATFEAWARQTPSPAYGYCWYNRWLGEFDPRMSANESIKRLEITKLSPAAQAAFERGWDRAKAEYSARNLTANTKLKDGQ